jgi:hypothetical protein
LQGKQFVRGRRKLCLCCSPVFDQSLSSSRQLLEIMKGFLFWVGLLSTPEVRPF